MILHPKLPLFNKPLSMVTSKEIIRTLTSDSDVKTN